MASGVIRAVVAEAGLVPTEFSAVTVQVYATSFASPETVMGDDVLVPAKLLTPSEQMAVYPVIAHSGDDEDK